MNGTALIKKTTKIMYGDAGVSGTAQYMSQLIWILFLKVFDYKEEEWELNDDYEPVIPEPFRFRDWAAPKDIKKRLSGEGLVTFVNDKLFPFLKGETIEYRYIGEGKKRLTRTMDKSEYYLMYAEKVYNFQRTHLYKKSEGVYWDMLGAKGAGGDNIAYETVDGVRYRGHNEEENPLGESYSYNSGTMLSGAADLYGVTGRQEYLDDMKALSVNSFRAFAKKCTKYPELYDF